MAGWVNLGMASKADSAAEATAPPPSGDEYLTRLHRAGLGPLIDAVRTGPAWASDAACRGSGVNFFPGRGESLEPAKAVCAQCSVIDECAAWARSHDVTAGVWAGTTAARLHKGQRAA